MRTDPVTELAVRVGGGALFLRRLQMVVFEVMDVIVVFEWVCFLVHFW